MDKPKQTARPRKKIGKRPASLEDALADPKFKALVLSIADAAAGPLDNAEAHRRATRTQEEQVTEALRVLRGGAQESGWSAVSAPGIFVACGRCSPLDEPIDGCPDCRSVNGHQLSEIDWPALVVDHRGRVRWANREAGRLLRGARPIGKLLRSVAAWARPKGIRQTPIVLEVQTTQPWIGTRDTFRVEKSRFSKTVGMYVADVTLPGGRRISKLHVRAK